MEMADHVNPLAACLKHPHLTDEQFAAALEDDFDDWVKTHLAECASCSETLQQLRTFEDLAKHTLYRVDCLSLDEIMDYALNNILSADQQIIEEHLSHCQLCRDEVQTFLVEMSNTQQEQTQSNARPASVWEQV